MFDAAPGVLGLILAILAFIGIGIGITILWFIFVAVKDAIESKIEKRRERKEADALAEEIKKLEQHFLQKYNDPALAMRISKGEFWIGQTIEQLDDAMKSPLCNKDLIVFCQNGVVDEINRRRTDEEIRDAQFKSMINGD